MSSPPRDGRRAVSRLLAETGRAVIDFVEGAGYTVLLLLTAIAHIPSIFRRLPEVVGHMFTYGVRTFPVTAVVGGISFIVT